MKRSVFIIGMYLAFCISALAGTINKKDGECMAAIVKLMKNKFATKQALSLVKPTIAICTGAHQEFINLADGIGYFIRGIHHYQDHPKTVEQIKMALKLLIHSEDDLTKCESNPGLGETCTLEKKNVEEFIAFLVKLSNEISNPTTSPTTSNDYENGAACPEIMEKVVSLHGDTSKLVDGVAKDSSTFKRNEYAIFTGYVSIMNLLENAPSMCKSDNWKYMQLLNKATLIKLASVSNRCNYAKELLQKMGEEEIPILPNDKTQVIIQEYEGVEKEYKHSCGR